LDFGDCTDRLQVKSVKGNITDASFGRVNNQQEQTSRNSKAPAAKYIEMGCKQKNRNNYGGKKNNRII
jgi:hypothetical protein